jgi:hypothetical protein
VRLVALAAAALAIVAAGGCKGRSLLRLSVVDASMPAAAVRTEEPRQIHFTFTARDAVTFDWRGSDSTLRFWAKNIPPRTVQARPPDPTPWSSPGPWQEANTRSANPFAR